MIINLTNEQIEQVKWQTLKEISTKELVGELITRMSIVGELELLRILAEYQKSL